MAGETAQVPVEARFGLYLLAVIGTSAVAAPILASAYGHWTSVDVWSAGLGGAMVFGPMACVLAVAPVGRWAAAALTVGLLVLVTVSWWVFASNDSSTSALVFIWPWIGGVPAAAAFVAVQRWRANAREKESSAELSG